MKKILQTVGAVIIGILFICGGIWAIVWCEQQNSLAQRSRAWPHVTGYILKSEVVKRNTKAGGSYPEITYQYLVDGQLYKNTTIHFGQYPTNTKETRRKYGTGSEVKVFYMPSDPTYSCLEPGEFLDITYVAIAVGVLAILYGFAMFLFNFFQLLILWMDYKIEKQTH